MGVMLFEFIMESTGLIISVVGWLVGWISNMQMKRKNWWLLGCFAFIRFQPNWCV